MGSRRRWMVLGSLLATGCIGPIPPRTTFTDGGDGPAEPAPHDMAPADAEPGPVDRGPAPDALPPALDAGPISDEGPLDVGLVDGAVADAAALDGDALDLAVADLDVPDASLPDLDVPDVGLPDLGQPDAIPVPTVPYGVTIALRTRLDTYLNTRGGRSRRIDAEAQALGAETAFVIYAIDGSIPDGPVGYGEAVLLFAVDEDRFVTVEADGSFEARARDAVDPDTDFVVLRRNGGQAAGPVPCGDTIVLRSEHGTYVSVIALDDVQSTAVEVTASERLQVECPAP